LALWRGYEEDALLPSAGRKEAGDVVVEKGEAVHETVGVRREITCRRECRLRVARRDTAVPKRCKMARSARKKMFTAACGVLLQAEVAGIGANFLASGLEHARRD